MTESGAIPRFSLNVLRYGDDAPLPDAVPLRAGPVSALLVNGDLRHLRLGADEIVLRLYGAIRDRNWGTVEPRFTRYEVDAGDDRFEVRFTAECANGDVDFVWEGSYAGTSDGTIVATFDGMARAPFERNRIGWCLLHPMTLAGVSAAADTPAGEVAGEFPKLIAPWQPFMDMQSLRHEVPAGAVTFRFSGDLFEMEDQRNWTDASFKTYSTPLSLPMPVKLTAGDRVQQRIEIRVAPDTLAGSIVDLSAPARISRREGQGAPLPSIGLSAAGHGEPLNEREIELLRALHPGHLRLSLDLTKDDWEATLAIAARDATALGVPLELAVIAEDDGGGLADCFARLAASQTALLGVLVFPADRVTTTPRVFDVAREAADSSGLKVPLGGGSRGYFTDFNRQQATMPLADLDVAGYGFNPQVHAFDNRSLMETTRAQPETVRSARAIVGETPLSIGPITLRPRVNPHLTSGATNPDPLAIPPSVDVRQPSLFTAAWTLASLANLLPSNVTALTFFETTGWRGVLERTDHPLRVKAFHSWQGMAFPVYHVLAEVGDFAGGQAAPVVSSDPLSVAALLLERADRRRLLLANLIDDVQEVIVAADLGADLRVRVLDETTMVGAASEPAAFRGAWQPVNAPGGELTVTMLPYAVVAIEAAG